MTDNSGNEIQSHLLHVHVCIQCGHVLRREELDSRQVASGVIRCPKCGLADRDNFVVRGMHEEDLSDIAVLNIAAYVGMTMISFYRCMGDPQPDRVGTWAGALLKHLVRRHKTKP